MKRLLAALKTDVTVQLRTQLYTIGIGVGGLVAVALSQLARPDQLHLAVPTLMLLIVGSTTMFYVAGLILFEREEGTLYVVVVSPLRTSEYLGAKIITLTALATLEAVVMIGGAMVLMRFSSSVPWPHIPLLLLGIVAIGILYTLVGIILVVRYDTITDFLIPMAAVAVVLQLPFLHFLDLVVHPAFLTIPTSAPTMLMLGAYVPLTGGQWVYAVGYTVLCLSSLGVWAYRAFVRHIIIRQAG